MSSIKSIVFILLSLAFVVVILIIKPISAFEQGVVIKNGQVASKLMPGTYWSVPYLHEIKTVDMRSQSMQLKGFTIDTTDFKGIDLDVSAVWLVVDPSKFATSNTGALRNQIKTAISSVLSNIANTNSLSQLPTLSMSNALAAANQVAEPFGVKIMVLKLSNIKLPDAVNKALNSAMQANLNDQLNKLKNQGAQSLVTVNNDADNSASAILAQGQLDAANIRAAGDKQAGSIYNAAYGANPKFYAFYRSLQAYGKAFNHAGTELIIKPEGTFFQFFNGLQGLKN